MSKIIGSKIINLCLAGAFVAGASPAFADSPFDGTWKGQLQSVQMESKPDIWSIAGGTYNCSTCIPAVTTKADGGFHAVPGHDYYDEMSVTVVDPMTVKYVYRKGGKEVASSTDTVSADGNTLTSVSRNTNNAKGVPIDVTAVETRLAPAPAGAHMTSGSWNAKPASNVSEAAMVMTMKVDGDAFHLATATGETIDAKIGGSWAPNVGDPGKTVTKVERVGPRAIKLTDQRAGKMVGVTTYTISADGKWLDGAWVDPRTGSKGSFKAMKM